MRDLSEIHGPLVERNAFDPEEYLFADEHLAEFHDRGFIAGIPVLSEAELARLRAEIEELSDPDHDGRELWYEYQDLSENGVFQGGFLHGSGAWRVRPGFHDLLWNPAITVRLRQLVGGSVRLLHDQVLAKPSGQGGSVLWHQDYSYWRYTQPMCHATCWVALDDATVENGCLQYIPGSHRWGVLLPQASKADEAMDYVFGQLTTEQRAAFTPVPAEVPAGSAVFHHPLVIHSSAPNRSAKPRRATTIHVMRDGTRAAVDLPEVNGLPAWLVGGAGEEYPLVDEPAGSPLGGKFFPVLI
ncbi:phytanoyl-CoA dioxygenase family protein [Gandjariella thermophila]|uniref:Phytanoyl-CoA dioxygenase family protein n=1 Tax=Gandjariella thermophila TaxID=1931992 RepID=A0A4D4JEH0_9PSEU|nr:phytanoyl-CoA dioxygenase family protein [Gandjariella thermophila]GDY33812.1 hypothetical protein GTS_54450 [Gandjariella thermophila]